ncbi:group II intron reverse transcriptase/maturase [Bacillus sp. AFS077874]|uniref:group II intron reverse transcriptase/maturase n=1 Tax=unclassified Bacillus (in: firmicutes) TaxID=185979 RepID=UPI000BEC859D|nr:MULTISPECIES: group II intron reverse transcriptase/maturase [unclassified Bacillus (in: firmicutes)]PEC50973.1 group II intron reverse transcriptase/maturase [Bacillus sp. AFS096315]PET71561.1 group II intron reverse transcriptase/maturase [Bacillus sp. AFS001701]PFM83235.1 group II intron reverse transcriptase/maturase [Bacillus sp. AFS077874]
MTTGLERIAVKARQDTKLQFTSLAHHITKELIWTSLNHMPKNTSPGIDGITRDMAIIEFEKWVEDMMNSIHRFGYKPPAVRRVWIPKPGKVEKRPIGVPSVADRALQRSTATVLSTIYEQDFLNCSFGGRPNRGAHNALATLNETISGKKVSWVLEADLKNFFGTLNHDWVIKFVQHRIGDPRIISLIKRWLKAGVMEGKDTYVSETGTPQGGSISVLLSNIYLHYVLDLWFERAIKPRLKGEAYLIRYIDDFVVCFQFRSDALRFGEVLKKRLTKFSLELEPNKTRLVEFGRFASKHAKQKGSKLETIYFLGFTHYCTRNRKGNFMVGRKTEKTRFKRSVNKIQETLRIIRHWSIKDQTEKLNQILRGHYNYYGIAGNLWTITKIYKITERYWRKMLSSRSQKSYITWEKFNQIKSIFPLERPKLSIPFSELKMYAKL